ncbi:Hypothetical protein SRAE_1000090400 [Strongyloides ratti]|uniref:Uncharacterized protein n=1 Tax=Strongyloides ratti TaxID=34506 RepID=A0A090L572_STRRB|nr:Hypothetical protein SRAE_1000090400 [Strongyloides ratti]CEF62634.1 Hypothetical protein SRAE_1000090400 [Strongyloides ratti]
MYKEKRKVYLCGTSPNIHPPLTFAPLTQGISRMNSAIMRGASLFKGEEYDEFEPIDNESITENKNEPLFDSIEKIDIPEAEIEITTKSSVTESPINLTSFKDELDMINKTKNLINLFEEKARKLYEKAEQNINIKTNKEKCNCSDFDLEDINETQKPPVINKKITVLSKTFINGKSIKNMTKEDWEIERNRQRLEEEKLIEERTKEFHNERMLSDSINTFNGIEEEESSGIDDIEITSSTTEIPTTTFLSTKKISRNQILKKNKTPPHCDDGYFIAITNKPFNELLIPLHRAEMSSELRQLESYVNRKLISWGQYSSYPMNYKGYFSQKYIMKNPKECRGLEKFTKKAVSYGIFMEGGIFQCKCGSIKTIAKVH